MYYLDVFFTADPGDVACEGKVFVPQGPYWHLLVTNVQEKTLPRGYVKFSELVTKRADGKAFHTFSGHLERLESRDGGFSK